MPVRIVNTNSSSPIHSDVDFSFNRNPKTGDALLVTNLNAVKQSIRNLLNTSFGERLFQPRFCNVYWSRLRVSAWICFLEEAICGRASFTEEDHDFQTICGRTPFRGGT